MKKVTFIALALGLLTIVSCGEKKAEAPAPAAAPVEEVITDSATQAKAAGDYCSPDGSTVITLGSDFTAKVKGYNKEYYKWEFTAKPEGSSMTINLVRKGMDTDIKDDAMLDLDEEKIVIKNETLRKKK